MNEMVCDAEDNIWFLTDRKAVTKFDRKHFTRFYPSQLLSNPNYASRFITLDPQGNLWCLSEGKVFTFGNGTFHAVEQKFSVRNLVAIGPAYREGVWAVGAGVGGRVRLVHLTRGIQTEYSCAAARFPSGQVGPFIRILRTATGLFGSVC